MFTGEPWKHVPLRVFLSKSCRQIQRLVGISNAANEPLTLREVLNDWVNDFSDEKHEVLLHGVPAPLEAPLQWLGVNMSYADNFLYIVVRPKWHTSDSGRLPLHKTVSENEGSYALQL